MKHTGIYQQALTLSFLPMPVHRHFIHSFSFSGLDTVLDPKREVTPGFDSGVLRVQPSPSMSTGNVGNGSGSLENRHWGVPGDIREDFLEKTDQSQFSISFLSSGLVFFIQVTLECDFFLSWEE